MTAPPKPTLPVLFCSLALDKCSDDERALIAKIDDILPQTQCGLCGHHDGCLPYAYGIVVVGEAHNLCVPGGQALTDEIFKQLAPHLYYLPPQANGKPTLPPIAPKKYERLLMKASVSVVPNVCLRVLWMLSLAPPSTCTPSSPTYAQAVSCVYPLALWTVSVLCHIIAH